MPAALKWVHIVGLCWIALATVLLMTPAAYHRIVENGEDTERFHRVESRLLLAAMALAPGLAAAVWLVLEIVSGSRAAGAGAGATVVVGLYAAWFGWTWGARRGRSGRRRESKTPASP